MRPRPLVTIALLGALAFSPSRAHALVWPDVPERVERGLASADPSERRLAAQEIGALGPARGAPLALRALGDGDTEVRLAAAQSAIHLRVAEATGKVLPWLGDREARVRIAACEVARALPDPHATAALARALGDPDAAVRAGAADALGAQGTPDAVAPLLGRLDDASPTVRVQIARALARLGDARAVVPLVGKVQDSVSDVRQAVARALGDLGDPRASQALVLELRDNMDEVRVEALAALGRLRADDAVDAIAPLSQEHKPAVRQAAIAALGHIRSPQAVRALLALLGTGDDASQGASPTPVREALVAAGAVAGPALVAVLSGTPGPSVATSAAWVLGELHAPAYEPVLVAAMRRGVLPIPAALHALGSAGLLSAESAPVPGATANDAVPVVLEFIDDASVAVRTEALAAAASLLEPSHADGRAVEPLGAALRDPRLSGRERAKLATLLGRTGAARAAPVLQSLLSAHDPALRVASIDALGMLGPGAGDPLIDLLSDPDPSVRLHAAVALGDAGSAAARDTLVQKLGSPEELDRPAVLTALGGILSRAPSPAATATLERALELAAGPERDALLIALGRGASPGSSAGLTRLARSGEVDDRRTIATVLGALHAEPAAPAIALLRTMIGDVDPEVRAQAAWALGEVGDATSLETLEPLATSGDMDVAVDAVAAMGRIAARTGKAEVASRALCPRELDARPFVRANALAGLALSGARCGDGAAERRLLAEDTDAVRAAAALAVSSEHASSDDVRALERCAATDRSGSVSRRCREQEARIGHKAPVRTHAVDVYVLGEAPELPRPRATYAIELGDGLIHAGTADRRGAVFDPNAPEGELALRRPAPLTPPPSTASGAK